MSDPDSAVVRTSHAEGKAHRGTGEVAGRVGGNADTGTDDTAPEPGLPSPPLSKPLTAADLLAEIAEPNAAWLAKEKQVEDQAAQIAALTEERDALRARLADDQGMTSWAKAVVRNFERDQNLGVDEPATPGDWYRHAAAKLADKWLARNALSQDTEEGNR